MSIKAKPITGDLGPRQQQFVDGPNGPAMVTYVCAGCNKKFPDTGSYFYDRPNTKCIWCTKFPKGVKKHGA